MTFRCIVPALPVAAGSVRTAARLLLAAFGVAAAANALAATTPFPARNLTPLTALFGIPEMRGAETSPVGSASLRIQHVNNFTAGLRRDQRTPQAALFDGESSWWTLRMTRPISRGRGEWSLEVPAVWHTGGAFDRVIDEFHSLVGFDDSGRADVPRDRLNYAVLAGSERAGVSSATVQLGDVRAGLGWQLVARERTLWRARAQVKLPTGRARRLAGSGGTDVAVWIEGLSRSPFQLSWLSASYGVGAAWLGRGDVLADRQRRFATFAHVGMHATLTDRWRFALQLDGHSELMHSALRQLGGAAVTVTGGMHFDGARHWWHVALSEDWTGRSAPDVMFQFQFGRRFR